SEQKAARFMALETVGKYEIRGRLGAGAMGTVMDAFDPVIERRSALKIVRKPEAGDAEGAESLARFKREAKAAGRLNHPNIVAVYDYGEDGENAWIAMELVEGGTLKETLDRGERFPLAQTVRVMEEMLAALDYSHKRGVVHRDIKPANIMLTGDGSVKIADFGIARIENSSMTQVGTVMGTPSYMAPEQLRGEPVDARADIWASGVMLYQLLTGEKPFEGGFSAMQHKAIHTEPTPPSVLSVTAPRAFDAVISKALAKRPEDRFATAGAFAEAIKTAQTAPAAPLPMADADATIVSSIKRPAASAPAATPSVPVAKSGPPVMLIGGATAAVLVAGVAAFLFLGGEGTTPVAPPPSTIALAPASPPAVPAPAAPPTTILTPAAPAPTQRLAETAPTAPTLVPPTPVVPAPAQPGPATPGPFSGIPSPEPVRPAPAAPVPVPVKPEPTAERPIPPVAEPPIPRVQQLAVAQPPRLDFRAAAMAAAAAPACGLIAASGTDTALTLEGVVRRTDEASLRQALAARDIPLASARLAVQSFDGPYCPAMDMLRPVLAAVDLAPRVQALGNMPLTAGQLLRFDVTMPDWAGNLYVAYFMSTGEVAHLVPSATHPAGATVRLGEPRAGFPGWEVSEPFGTDLLVAVVSEGPLFATPRPQVETQQAYLAALGEALRVARQARRRVLVRPLVVETVAR
ncbi:MAG: putative serine/threonine protein kinase, partial [Rubritepida sp.]|nr:putative serine/threonine protein kinase [Rubritepida sp.]